MQRNLLVLSLLLFCNYGVEGRKATKEDLELERQLKLLNKPAIKTIQTEHGVYDCVDINKQPAFDNPLLKNHKVQMQPTSLQLQAADKDSSGLRSEGIELKDGGCPMGTVPIRRTTKEDLIKSKQFFGNGVSVPPSSSQIAAVGVSGGEAYYGTDFSLNIWNPPVKTQSYSSMAAVIQYASEIVQAGWLVHPGLFGDNQTHLYTFWAAGTRGPGCFNVQCPGFVQVNPAIPLGGLLTPYSTYLGSQYEAKVRLAMDLTTGDWWLFVGTDNKNVGYWPKSLFSHLSGGASQVSWTGVAAARPGLQFPPMGSGYFAEEGTGRSCYFRKVLVMDRIGIFKEMDQRLMYSGADSEHYSVKYTHQEEAGDGRCISEDLVAGLDRLTVPETRFLTRIRPFNETLFEVVSDDQVCRTPIFYCNCLYLSLDEKSSPKSQRELHCSNICRNSSSLLRHSSLHFSFLSSNL